MAAEIDPHEVSIGSALVRLASVDDLRVLDATGNLKAVQKLGHESIQTTGDIYTDWDIDQLAETCCRSSMTSPPNRSPRDRAKSLLIAISWRRQESNPRCVPAHRIQMRRLVAHSRC